MKAMLIDVHKLLVLYLTIPVTTATAERSFFRSQMDKKIFKKFNDAAKVEQLHAVIHSSPKIG